MDKVEQLGGSVNALEFIQKETEESAISFSSPRSRRRYAGGSIGEVCGAMRDVFGEYRGGAFF
jgi:hypothetical protein